MNISLISGAPDFNLGRLKLLQPLRWHCAEMHGSLRTECAQKNTTYM